MFIFESYKLKDFNKILLYQKLVFHLMLLEYDCI